MEITSVEVVNFAPSGEDESAKITAIFKGSLGNFNLICNVSNLNDARSNLVGELLNTAKNQLEKLPQSFRGNGEVTFNENKVALKLPANA